MRFGRENSSIRALAWGRGTNFEMVMPQLKFLWLCAFLLAFVSDVAAQTPARPVIRSWGYQLADLEPARLAASPYDALVIDYSRDGTEAGRLSAADVQMIKRRPDGSRRIVLAYLSIGEAEVYRYYWQRGWADWGFVPNFWSAPSWRASQNSAWKGNYAVRYWDPQWQALILGQGGYLDRIIEAGFDGVWLDKVDSAVERVASGRDSARDDMTTFVRRIRERGRKANANFLIIPQNGEELLADPGFRAVIDGLGVEDLLYGEGTSGVANDAKSIAKRRGLMSLVVADRKPVLAVEYLDDKARIDDARRELVTLGFAPHFADRKLATLRVGDYPSADAVAGRPSTSPMKRGIAYTTLALILGAVVFVLAGLLRRKPGA
jgi:cysteinyl-tRNA synthetase, unknown class